MKNTASQIKTEREWKEKALAYCKKKGWSLTYFLTSSADKEMERNP